MINRNGGAEREYRRAGAATTGLCPVQRALLPAVSRGEGHSAHRDMPFSKSIMFFTAHRA